MTPQTAALLKRLGAPIEPPITIPVSAEMRAALAAQQVALYQRISAEYAERAHGRRDRRQNVRAICA